MNYVNFSNVYTLLKTNPPLKKLLWCFLLFFILNTSLLANNTEHNPKIWTNVNVAGKLHHEKFKYLLEAHARLQDKNTTLQQAIARVGFGYNINPIVSLGLGYDFVPTKDILVNRYNHEHRFWQQVLFNLSNDGKCSLISRTRLEQRFNERQPGTAFRLRHKVVITFPQLKSHINPLFYEEIFFNLNHPSWVNNDIVEQLRLFLGVSIPIKIGSVRVGYLNQYQHRNVNNKMNHIINVSLLIHHDLLI